MILLLFIVINLFNGQGALAEGESGPANIEVVDAKNYWELYSIVHRAGSSPVLSMSDVVQSLIKLHEFTKKLDIDEMRKSYINQRIHGLIDLNTQSKDLVSCSEKLIHQLKQAEEENQDYTMHLVPYIHKMEDKILSACQEKVSVEVEKMLDTPTESMRIFNLLTDYVLNAELTEGDELIPGLDYRRLQKLEKPYDYIPHQQIVNGLIDYLDENLPTDHFAKNRVLFETFGNTIETQITETCKEIMKRGEPILDQFDAIYEADETKVNSFDDPTLKFITGLRVCEHLKYINRENVIQYFNLYRSRAKINVKTRNHQFSVRRGPRRV